MKLPPYFKCHGGKSLLKDFIISNFPKNYTELNYVELCMGGGSVFLNKERSNIEIINDLDKNVSNVLYHLRCKSNQFIELINKIDYTKKEFEKAKNGTKEGFEGAVNELVVRRMSRGGLKKDFSWSKRLRGGIPGDANAWNNFKKILHKICGRLQQAILIGPINLLTIINQFDKNYFIYLDPPYLHETRKVTKAYDIEMTRDDHEKMCQLLVKTKAKVLLSGYDNSLYQHYLKDWKIVIKDVANHSGQTKIKQRRTEYLWKNYE